MTRSWTKTLISSICMTAVVTLGYALVEQASQGPLFYGSIQNLSSNNHLQAQ